MNREQIIAAAKECGMHENWNESDWYSVSPYQLERFYTIAFEDGRQSVDTPVALAEAYRCGEDAGRQAEREECAKVCESIGLSNHGEGRDDSEAYDCADAIRARGDSK